MLSSEHVVLRLTLGAIHKRRPQSGRRRVIQCGYFSVKRGKRFQNRTSALFGAKYYGFFEICGVSARKRGEGLSQCGYFADKGEGS